MQLTLGLKLQDEATFVNFYPGNNSLLLKHLRAFSNNDCERFIYLWGAPGSGRSHLLQACCHAVKAGQALYLNLADSQLKPEVLAGTEYFALTALDNIDAVVDRMDWSMALFNFFNYSMDCGSRLLVSSLIPPAQLSKGLPDLCSRLSSGLIMNLSLLNDEQKSEALKLRAKRRGLTLSTEAAKFMLSHYSREMNDLLKALELLDNSSMITQHQLTIPFIKQTLSDIKS